MGVSKVNLLLTSEVKTLNTWEKLFPVFELFFADKFDKLFLDNRTVFIFSITQHPRNIIEPNINSFLENIQFLVENSWQFLTIARFDFLHGPANISPASDYYQVQHLDMTLTLLVNHVLIFKRSHHIPQKKLCLSTLKVLFLKYRIVNIFLRIDPQWKVFQLSIVTYPERLFFILYLFYFSKFFEIFLSRWEKELR